MAHRFSIGIEKRPARAFGQTELSADVPRDDAGAKRGSFQDVEAAEALQKIIDDGQAPALQNKGGLAPENSQIPLQQEALQPACQVQFRITQGFYSPQLCFERSPETVETLDQHAIVRQAEVRAKYRHPFFDPPMNIGRATLEPLENVERRLKGGIRPTRRAN